MFLLSKSVDLAGGPRGDVPVREVAADGLFVPFLGRAVAARTAEAIAQDVALHEVAGFLGIEPLLFPARVEHCLAPGPR